MKIKKMTLPLKRLFSFAKKYQLGYGLVFSVSFPLISLPIRLAEMHRDTVSNLIGSQIVMFLHGLATWLFLRYVIKESGIVSRWVKILLGLLGSALLSIVFFELSPFEDFPWLPIKQLPTSQRILQMINKGAFREFFIMLALLLSESQEQEREAKIKIDQLAEDKLSSQINALTYQLDPHFLFNSLNVLKSGATESWVKNYIIQLSGIYRYLLNHSHGSGLSLLGDELQFTLAYVNILMERFETGLIFHDLISEDDKKRSLPVLAMQILVENAVKHNILAPEFPLQIHVYCDDSYLVIANNLQPKQGYILGVNSGIGLQNLQERCQLLVGKNLVIAQEKNSFLVKVPMI